LLKRAFRDTYGIDMDDILHVDDLTIETYRSSIAHVFPEMTQVALASRKQKVLREKPDLAREREGLRSKIPSPRDLRQDTGIPFEAHTEVWSI